MHNNLSIDFQQVSLLLLMMIGGVDSLIEHKLLACRGYAEGVLAGLLQGGVLLVQPLLAPPLFLQQLVVLVLLLGGACSQADRQRHLQSDRRETVHCVTLPRPVIATKK